MTQQRPNYRLIATKIGEMLKYNTTFNEIGRTAHAIFNFKKEDFPNCNITSSRSQEIYDWIMTLAKQLMNNSDRDNLLISFCNTLTPEELQPGLEEILRNGGIAITSYFNCTEFMQRKFHAEIHKHSKTLYLNKHYFHAVFEACKVYNKLVKNKAQSDRDGHSLMMEVWAPAGVLKVTQCKSETDKNVQDGIKFLSAGLMQAVRNPTAHEPAVDWPISKEDCLDILSFISFLFNKLDQAVYYNL